MTSTAKPGLGMEQTDNSVFTVRPDDVILVTGATGFIGAALVETLLDRGFRNVRCFARPSSNKARLEAIALRHAGAQVSVVTGNLLSRADCIAATRDAALVFHLAAGTGHKSFPDAFMNSVVTTRNLLDASVGHNCLKRFVSVSSFAVYTNTRKPTRRLLDESCPVEDRPALRGEAYCFAKVKQEQFVREYCRMFGLPHVIVRPGYVYGPGKDAISDRVGITTFGVFLHLGGSNPLPLTYVDNCADAIALAGLTKGIDGEVFNIVDDDLPSSRQFLRLYKRNVGYFRSLYVPHAVSYALCSLWERYSERSKGQLPPAFNRRKWNAYWRKTRYSNERLKSRLHWAPSVPTAEGLRRYFAGCRERNA
jgi:nucleoside-diphosphate-sugar epimerase